MLQLVKKGELGLDICAKHKLRILYVQLKLSKIRVNCSYVNKSKKVMFHVMHINEYVMHIIIIIYLFIIHCTKQFEDSGVKERKQNKH